MFQVPEDIYFTNLIEGTNKTGENLQWMKDFHCNEYIPFIINQYQKVSTHLSKGPIEGSIILFRIPPFQNFSNLYRY